VERRLLIRHRSPGSTHRRCYRNGSLVVRRHHLCSDSSAKVNSLSCGGHIAVTFLVPRSSSVFISDGARTSHGTTGMADVCCTRTLAELTFALCFRGTWRLLCDRTIFESDAELSVFVNERSKANERRLKLQTRLRFPRSPPFPRSIRDHC